VRALDHKLVRDVMRARGQVITTALVVAGGMAAYIALMGTYRALRDGQAAYYERNGYPHVFASLRRAPETEAARLRDLPEVAQLATRVVFTARLDLEGLGEPASGKIVSLPAEGEPGLPAVSLVSGRLPEAGRRGEALILESFAESNQLAAGDRVPVIVEGRRFDVEITGVAISPEYVMAIGPGGFFAPRRFGVLWMHRATLADETGMTGAFNDVTVRLRPGADEAEVIAGLDARLARWGGGGAFGREEQPSHRTLDGELKQLEGLALRLPLMFLGVEAFLLHVILGRFVRAQREQIAALKALGYDNRTIARHYLAFAAIIVGIGCLIGVLLGAWSGRWFTDLYAGYFRLPVLAIRFDASLLGTAVLVSFAAAFGGALSSVRAAAKLPPAEAMRPPAPSSYRRGWLSRLGVPKLLANTGRIVVRELERRPWRLLLSSAGLAMGMAILIVGRFQYDSLDWFVDVQLTRGMPADAMATYAQPVGAAAVGELGRKPGVIAVEAGRDVPVRVRLGHRERRLALHAVPADTALRKIMTIDGGEAVVPSRGVALGRSLVDALRARLGDEVTIEQLEGARKVFALPVTAIIEDMGGNAAYIDDALLHRLFAEERAATVAHVVYDAARIDAVRAELRASPWLTSISSRRAIVDMFNATTSTYSGGMTIIVVIFGSILAVGITYNNARITIAERARDLATLRVLGYSREEVSSVLLGELGVQLLLAIPLGMLLGFAFARAVMASIDPELYRFPLVIYPRTYAFAVLTVIGAGVVSALLARRRLDRLDLTEALKARD
jgi:putative ABC transport system permease protein